MEENRTPCACGAWLVAGAAWCHRCFAPVVLPTVTGPAVLPAQRLQAQQLQERPLPGSVRSSRFQATDVTFGPVGRIVITVVLLVPLAAFLAAIMVAPLAGIAGVVIWGGGIVPKALRDTWRRRPSHLR